MFARIIENYQAAFRGLPREVWILSLISLVNRSGTMVVIFLVLYLTEQRGFEAAEAGSLLSLYGLGTIGGIWLGGRLTDRLGHRTVILASLLATGIVMFILGALRTPATIAGGVALLGVAGETFRPAMAVAVTASSERSNRPRAFGLLRLSLNLGMTIGPALGGFLAQVDYAWLFRVDGATCIAAALIYRRLLPRTDTTVPTPTEERTSGDSAWRDRVFMWALLLTLVQALIFFQLASTFPLYLSEQRGYSKIAFGGFFAVNTLVIVLFEMVLVHAIERRNPLRVAAVAGLLIGVGFGLMPFVHAPAAIIGTVLIWTLGEMLGAPMMQTWVANRASESNRGQYLAGFSMVFSVAAVIAPWLGTRIYQHVSPDAVWYGCLALGILQLFGFLALAKRQ